MTGIEQLKNMVLRQFSNDNVSIILFGSMARGTEYFGSDVDIGILPKGEFNDDKITLLREEIEQSNIPFFVDIADFSKVDKSFLKEALKGAEFWKH